MRSFSTLWLRASLICLSLFVALGVLAEGRGFANFKDGVKYRFVSVNPTMSAGSIGLGSAHGSVNHVYYVLGTPTEDCYWFAEAAATGWRFRNATTGQYLVFTESKDYVTHVRLTLDDKSNDDNAVWKVGFHEGHFNFSYMSDKLYHWSVSSERVTSSGVEGTSESVLFDVYDAAGQRLSAPVNTYLVSYVDQLKINNRPLPYDQTSRSYFFPVPTDRSGKISFSFDTIDESQYDLAVVSASGVTVSDWSQVKTSEKYELVLCRDGKELARGPITFTLMPLLSLSYRGEIAPPLSADGVIQKPKLNGSVQVLSDHPAEDLACATVFRRRGATASNYPKRSLNMDLYRPDGTELDTLLLGLRNAEGWILDAMSIDVIRMRNRVCFDVWNDYSRLPYASKHDSRNGTVGRFVEVILNGEYAGIYCLTDKINRKLLNLTKPEVSANSDLLNVRGVLYKSNSWDNTSLSDSQLDASQTMDKVDWNNWELKVPDEYPAEVAWKPLRDLYAFSTQYALQPHAYEAKLEDNFYLQNLADFYILALAFNMVDNGNKNIFLSVKNIQKEKRFVLTPWDMDTSLGGYYDGRFSGGNYDMTEVSDVRIQKNEPFQSLFVNNGGDFRRLAADRWFKLKRTVFSPASLEQRMMNYAQLFANSGAWEREVRTWSVKDGTPVVDDVVKEVSSIMNWYRDRVKKMDAFFLPYTTDPTGIETVKTVSNTNEVYSLDGRRFPYDQAPQGVYIRNGQKVVKTSAQ